MTKRSVRCHLEPAGQTSEGLCAYIAGEAVRMIGDIGYGIMKFSQDDMSMVAQMLRVHQGSSKAGQVRHFVISPDRRRDQKQAWELVQKICHPLIKVHAPDRYWLLGYHVGTPTPHGHLAVANVGPDGKALQFDRTKFLSILNLEFTDAAVSSRGRGRKKGVRVYPNAKNLKARDLAQNLVGPENKFLRGLYKQMRQDGRVVRVWKKKKSKEFVFAYEAVKIGSDTLRYFLDEETRRRRSMGEVVRELVSDDGQFRRGHYRAMRRSGQLARKKPATDFVYEFRRMPISAVEMRDLLKDEAKRRRSKMREISDVKPAANLPGGSGPILYPTSSVPSLAPPVASAIPSHEDHAESAAETRDHVVMDSHQEDSEVAESLEVTREEVEISPAPTRARPLVKIPPEMAALPRPQSSSESTPKPPLAARPVLRIADIIAARSRKSSEPKLPSSETPAPSLPVPSETAVPSPEPTPEPLPKRPLVKVPPVTPASGPPLPSDDELPDI